MAHCSETVCGIAKAEVDYKGQGLFLHGFGCSDDGFFPSPFCRAFFFINIEGKVRKVKKIVILCFYRKNKEMIAIHCFMIDCRMAL